MHKNLGNMGPENTIRTSAGWPRHRNERNFKILEIHTLCAIMLAIAIAQGVPGCAAAPAFPRNHSPNHEKASHQTQSPAHEASEPGLELCPRACEGDDDFDCWDDGGDGNDDADEGGSNSGDDGDDALLARGMINDNDDGPTVKLVSSSLPPPLRQALQHELKQALASGLEQAGSSSTESEGTSATATQSDVSTQQQSTPSGSFTSSETPVLPSSSVFDVSGTPSTPVNAPTSLASTLPIASPLSSDASLPEPTLSTEDVPTPTNSDTTIETDTATIATTTITTTTVSHSSSSLTSHTSHTSAIFASHRLNQGPGLAVRPSPGVDLMGGLSHDFDSTRGSHRRATMVIGLVAAVLTISTAIIFTLHLFLKTRKKRAERLNSRGSIRGFGTVEWMDASRKKDNWHPAPGDTGKLAGSTEKSPPASRRDSLLSHWLRLNPDSPKDGRNSRSRLSLLPRLGALLGRSFSTSGPAPKRVSPKKERILDIRPYDLGSRFSVSSSDVPLDESFGTLASLQSLEVIDLEADDDHGRLTPNRQNLASLSTPTSPNVGEDPVLADLMGEQQTLLRASSVPVRRSKTNVPAHARTRSAPEGPADPHSPAPEPLTPTIGKHKSQSQSMSAVTISSKYSSMPPCDSDWDISDAYRHSTRGTLQSRKSERKSGASNRLTTQSIGNGWTSARNSDYTMYRRSDW
ncbi:hypothetical protein EYR40_010812 [Pleurotus pulmonarius]|nr:hypothetical protein EYR36_002583 [Pleurotus pulmonarius]KAF4586796.1 hypothetical protein EYR40_010812 [Pleurotus pulmonarius]